MYIIRTIFGNMFYISAYRNGTLHSSGLSEKAMKLSQIEAMELLSVLESSPVTRGMYKMEVSK